MPVFSPNTGKYGLKVLIWTLFKQKISINALTLLKFKNENKNQSELNICQCPFGIPE